VLYLCELLGIEHGVDFNMIMDTGHFISDVLKRQNLSTVTVGDLEALPQRRLEIQKLLL
jgi:hypothetical protein